MEAEPPGGGPVIRAVLAALRVRGLEPTDKLLLALLADHANEEGLAWPSVSRLAAGLERTERTVQLALKRLEAKGLIQRLDRPGKPTLYRLLLEEVEKPADPEAHFTPETHFTPEADFAPKPVSERGETHFGGGVKPISPEPVIEPVIEPATSSSPPYSPPPEPDAPGEDGEEVKAPPEGEEPGGLSKESRPEDGPGRLPLGEESPGGSPISPGAVIGMSPVSFPRAMNREEALAELARRRRPAPPPEAPAGMVRALVEAGVWERLVPLRRLARDGRAWQEWLAGPLAALWGQATPEAFAAALGEAMDALARRPEVASPFAYVERIVRSRLRPQDGEAAPPLPQTPANGEPGFSPERLEALFQGGIPLRSGSMGQYLGLEPVGRKKVFVLDPLTEAVAVLPLEEALRRVGALEGGGGGREAA